jgi:hypothetical protein
MSGTFENWIESLASNWLPKLPWIGDKMISKGERSLAGSHVTLMAFITLGIDVAALMMWKWLAVISITSFILIYNAEKGPEGRKVDWITRSFGWAIGSIPAIFILVFY